MTDTPHLGGLSGRTAIVTGAAQGLGAEIARALHADGASIVVADLDADGAARTAQELGDRTVAVAVDVRERAAFETMLATALDTFGALHIVVNNAARTVPRPFFEIDADEWDDVLAVNLRSVLFGCQVLGGHLRDAGQGGRIVNLGSMAGQIGGLVAGAHYAASKAGIGVVTKIAAAALAPYGVTVNTVAPAAIAGPAMDAMDPAAVQAAVARIPVGRAGQPQEVAGVVAWLCSDDAASVTGATYDVNGGLFMR